MPPGLYPIPRHHLYGAGVTSRPTFNAKDFEDADTNAANGELADGNGFHDAEKHVTGRVKKQKKKKSKERRNSEKHVDGTAIPKARPALPMARTSPGKDSPPPKGSGVSPSTKTKRIKQARKREATDPTPEMGLKKRKRTSEVQSAPPTAPSQPKDGVGQGFVIGEDLVRELETSMGGIGATFMQNVQESEVSAREKSKFDKKSGAPAWATIDKVILTPKKPGYLLGALPDQAPSQQSPKKTQKARYGLGTLAARKESPREKSSVPLPPRSATKTTATKQTPAPKKSKEPVKMPEVIVPETPPRRVAQMAPIALQTPVPFPSEERRTQVSPFKLTKKKLHQYHFSSSPFGQELPSSTAPAALEISKKRQKSVIALPTSLTPAATQKVIQPLTDETKPKPLPKIVRHNSATTSIPSSRASSVSIPDMFNRVGKPYSRSGAAVDPFVTPEMKKARLLEMHQEAGMNMFNDKFSEVQKYVDFSGEQEYLNQYLDWHKDNDSEYPFPCLGPGSGCTPKKEEILRLGKEENVDVSKAMAVGGGDATAVRDANERAHKAEEFLALAIRARVPVPIGRLEGTWTLYSPKYAMHHFDKYGFGARTMTISSIAGFKDRNKFTARLSIPPRSMTYSTMTFSAPSHASFRVVPIKTVPEGYDMEVTFLGNGFLHLRVDLNLLLKGKPTELVGGKKVYMEFVGTHEKAVDWEEQKDELEEVGKKLFAKYGRIEDS